MLDHTKWVEKYGVVYKYYGFLNEPTLGIADGKLLQQVLAVRFFRGAGPNLECNYDPRMAVHDFEGKDQPQIVGPMAVVTAGLVINHEGRRRLLPSSWNVLIRTWEQIGFWATSLIFLLAAMMVCCERFSASGQCPTLKWVS